MFTPSAILSALPGLNKAKRARYCVESLAGRKGQAKNAELQTVLFITHEALSPAPWAKPEVFELCRFFFIFLIYFILCI